MQTKRGSEGPSPALQFARRDVVLTKWFPGSSATLYRRIKDGTFPAPVRIGPGIAAWRVPDLEAWATAQGRRS